ncbi:MAG: DUF421 domain-containing protein [Ruminococcus sp.]|nr:DUF421 domain-containing protein [Ruminococcus sp.]
MLIVLLRAVILYIVIIFCIRLMGKKQLGELQPSELVVTIMLSNIATLPIEDINIPIAMGLVPIFTIVCLDVFFSYLSLSSRKFRRVLCGSPKIIISDGVLDQKTMKKLRFTVDDLFEALRAEQVFDISEAQLAVVETTGKISVYVKKSEQPPSRSDLNICSDSKNPPQLVIDDGEILDKALEIINVDSDWLKNTLEKEGIKLSEVFIMTCDGNKNYNIIRKEI